MYDEPLHLSNENGLSLLSGKGYGAIITRDFFENINRDTVEFAQKVLAIKSRKQFAARNSHKGDERKELCYVAILSAVSWRKH